MRLPTFIHAFSSVLKIPLSSTELINNYMADIHKIELFGSCYNPSLPMYVIITKNIKIKN